MNVVTLLRFVTELPLMTIEVQIVRVICEVFVDLKLAIRIDQGVGSTSGIRACALRYFDLEKMELENSQNNALAKVVLQVVFLVERRSKQPELKRSKESLGSTSGIRACALRYFDLEKMELENSQNNALAKLPMLKLGEYEMWEIRIKQYFQIQDYALWEVIENGNSWVPIPVTAPESGPSTALKMTVPSTTEEKICKKNDVKARSLLLMALPNEHQLTLNTVSDAQSFFIAIKLCFGGKYVFKEDQKSLQKQQYENINATSSESLTLSFNRLQKLVSRLAILGVDTPPDDLKLIIEQLTFKGYTCGSRMNKPTLNYGFG
ncbi:hypothetical protein Tco_1192039 [Tanacetum coccineum]